MREESNAVWLGLIAMLIQSLSVIPIPLILKYAVDSAIPQKQSGQLVLAAIAFAFVNIATRVTAVASQHWIQKATKHATSRLRSRLGLHLFRTDFAYLDDVNGAIVHERSIGDAGRVEQLFTMLLRSFLPNIVMLVGLLFVLFYLDPVLTMVSGLVVPAMFLTTRSFRPMLQRSLLVNQGAFESLTKRLLLSVRTQAFLRARGMAGPEIGAFNDCVNLQQRTSASRVTKVGISQAVQGILVGFASAATLAVGGHAVIQGRITLGSMLSFFAAFALVRGPITTLASCSPQFIEGRQSCERIDGYIAAGRVGAETSTSGTTGALELTTLALENVTFRYASSEPLIHQFSMELRSGRIVALAGPNGSGKTTILGLLLGLLTPESGFARANGISLEHLQISLDTLRRQVGVAFQHAEFLPGSVRYNVQYGRPGLTDADLFLALAEAEAESLVASLSDGVDTWIGEDGDRLSGGERQRLAIARAIIGHPPIVILDEPNNHLPDTVIERVLARTSRWNHPPAILLISHDSAVLRLADETIRLDNLDAEASNQEKTAVNVA